jgi:hypothetical protein
MWSTQACGIKSSFDGGTLAAYFGLYFFIQKRANLSEVRVNMINFAHATPHFDLPETKLIDGCKFWLI